MSVLRHRAQKKAAQSGDALSHRRDRDLARAAAVAINLGALAKTAKILAEADAHLLEEAPPAGNRNHIRAQARIGVQESLLDLARQHAWAALQSLEAFRNAHEFAGAPNGLEVAAGGF